MFVIFLVKMHVDAEDDEDDENYVDCNRKTLIPGSRSKWAMGGLKREGKGWPPEIVHCWAQARKNKTFLLRSNPFP